LCATPGAAQAAQPSGPAQGQRSALVEKSTQGRDTRTLAEKRKAAGVIMRQMLAPENVAAMEGPVPPTGFGAEFARLAYENAYIQLWSRPGLSLKERSLVTIGILIGLGNDQELASHLTAGLRNGLTPKELEEVVYQATAYAGFPAASRARAVAAEVVAKEGKTP
jgi:alkylhydroperoxidase/carboxymuconolactone decarboxylase family protein YurZ